ncbi:flagellin N-terminal helical domain-containing protein [Isachenkonia alkalipeptolytica]|uniref:Flagellin n=1 Tax=Isachenkonia alkalipeptolytica TaxID=2565777 RepID=A0AA43XME7_9CLOT|nr:flagellin [Isachenkonia alkalipeptolytica]NBG89387.1 hypothetical protein [Isachenkonia alkalipeptolytica]
MRINHNIPALNAHRQLNQTNRNLGGVLERLSSGKRINKAADDAAGMAISEKMKAQVRGLRKASQNTLDGISLIQTAEGAMNEVHSMLQRMRELAVQSANGSSTNDDRKAIQDEVNQLTSEINRIANGTEFNTRNLLRGNEAENSNTSVHRMSTGSSAIAEVQLSDGLDDIDSSDRLSIFVDDEEKIVYLNEVTAIEEDDDDERYELKAKALENAINKAVGDAAEASLYVDGNDTYIEIKTTSIGGRSTIEIEGTMENIFGEDAVEEDGWAGLSESSTRQAQGSFMFNKLPEAGSKITIGRETIEFFDSSKEAYTGTNRAIDIYNDSESKLKSPADLVSEITNLNVDGVNLGIDGAYDDGMNDVKFSNRLSIQAKDTGFQGHLIYLEGTLENFNTNLQVGPNQGQGFRLEVGDIRATKLNISSVDLHGNPGVMGATFTETPNVTDGLSSSMEEHALNVSTEETATAAITVYDNAIKNVAELRGGLGAIQNRLEYTAANLDNTTENLTAALSRIEDADMALEMSEYTKLNILNQAGTSMLAQANQMPQSVLQLLGG